MIGQSYNLNLTRPRDSVFREKPSRSFVEASKMNNRKASVLKPDINSINALPACSSNLQLLILIVLGYPFVLR